MIRSACVAAATALVSALAHAACPDLSGEYRVASSGSGIGIAEALDMLRASAARPRSDLRLRGPDAQGLAIWIKVPARDPKSPGTYNAQPHHTLREGTDYRCSNGRVVFPAMKDTRRNTEQGFYEGESTVSLGGGGPGGLMVHVDFKGRERSTLWSYESARISIPKFGTGVTLRETLRWPEASNAPPDPEPPIPGPRAQPEEPKDVAAVRQRLNESKALGATMLNVLEHTDKGVRALLTATRSEHVIEMEDRLRDAAIPYEVKASPVWSANVYHMELLFWPPGVRADKPWRPSALRVEHELTRARRGSFEVRRVDATADGYVATLDVAQSESTADLVAGLKRSMPMFAVIEPISEQARADTTKWRVAQVKLRMP